MSGHNKWSTIKHKKAAVDAKRGKIFSRFSKEITLAAREGGGDPESNVQLRSAITAAKNVNMPNDNIDRAIKKGTGELGGGNLEELSYEGYGPGGVAVLVHCLSDNRNRTAANIRAYFTKSNSSLAGSGAVAWLFHRKSRFVVDGPDANEDKLLELLLEAGIDVDDISVSDGAAEILAAADAFGEVIEALEAAGVKPAESTLTMIPENTTAISEASTARQILRLIEALEEDDDVQEVYANFEFPDQLMEQLANE